MTLSAGTQLGRFVIERLLGEGGMGVVYEARDPELDRRVALKVLRAGMGELASLRLAREAQTLAQLSHPSVVAVHDVGVDGGRCYLAMELIEGETLDAWRARTKPSPRAILDAFVQAGRGLVAAHARQIVHRDFKPGNVLVDGDGRVRVTDFGLARQIDDAAVAVAPHHDAARAARSVVTTVGDERGAITDAPVLADGTPRALARVPLTAAGAVVGTPQYMAPEQRAGGVATAKSDQYAFCVALWEALVGVVPEPDPAPVRALPRWLARALGRGLALDPASRHRSMKDLIAVLERAPVRRRRRALVAGAFAIGAVAVAAGLAMAPSDRVDCARAGDAVRTAWSPDAAARVRATFTKARPYGADLATRVATELDGWTGRWRDARVDACRATHERGEQSAELLDKIGVCLDDQRATMRALVGRLAAADGAIADHALDAVRAMPPIASCSAAHVADRPFPDPVELLARAQLDQAQVAVAVGDEATAERAAHDAAAATTASPAVRAQALAIEGTMVGARDDARARTLLEQALMESARSGDKDAALFVAAEYLEHISLGDPHPQIEGALPILRAAIAAAGPSSPMQLLGADAEAHALNKLGRVDDGDRVCDRIASIEPAPTVRAAECRCANAVSRDTPEARAACKSWVDAATRLYGPDHLHTGKALLMEGNALENAGAYDDGLAARRHAARIADAASPLSSDASDAHFGVGRSLVDLVRYPEAKAELQHTLAIDEAIFQPPNERVFRDHMTLARTEIRTHETAAGERDAAAAIAMADRLFRPDDPKMIEVLIDYGFMQRELHAPEAALNAYQRAERIADQVLPPTSSMHGMILADQADAQFLLHRPRETVRLADRAIAAYQRGEPDPWDVANAHQFLVEGLFATGDVAHGRKEAVATRDRCAAIHYDSCAKNMADLAERGAAALDFE